MSNRRVGYNELSAIEACKAYVAAQDEYFRLRSRRQRPA